MVIPPRHNRNTQAVGAGVIWNGIPYEPPVIPAKAGIHWANPWKCADYGLDSRFRGNDDGLERPFLANGTTTRPSMS
jgi:hypothetical protein